MPAFPTYTCSGASLGGNCSATALNTLVFGRGQQSCVEPPASNLQIGMCNFYDRIVPANVVVRYEFTGLGYAGRPGGAVPTITVSLQNINFQFFFLDERGNN